MQFDIITLFPKMFDGPLTESILTRAQKMGLIAINYHQLRDWGIGKHRQVDDTIYGGGVGMLLRPDVVIPAITEVKKVKNNKNKMIKKIKQKVILMTPQGRTFNQKIARRLAKQDRLIVVCGHYEGFDKRICQFVDEEISIGDYVLTGGELPAMVLVDSISRLIPGVLSKDAILNESFSFKPVARSQSPEASRQKPVARIEYPQYTKPENYKGLHVPEILLSGNHQEIERWRQNKIQVKQHNAL